MPVVVTMAVALAACGPVEQRRSRPSIPVTRRDVPMPRPGRTEVAGAYWPAPEGGPKGSIVVAGGFVPSGGGVPTPDVFFFDLGTKRWSKGPDLPAPRHHAMLAVLRGTLYLAGGFERDFQTARVEVLALDTRKDPTWDPVASMGTRRAAGALVAVNGHLLVIGGTDVNAGVGDPKLRTTELYDPTSDAWSPGPQLHIGRQHTGAATVDNKVYAVAGRPPNLTSVESLVVKANGPVGGWKTEPSLEFSRGGNGAAAVAGIPCTAGGEEQAGTIAPIECLRKGRWRHVADLGVPRHGLAVVGVGRRLHVISGGDHPGFAFTTTHEVLAL